MLRLILLAALATAAWAQNDNPFNRPPAEVDQALRARITEFFQYHVTGEFRKAEAIVAEDTKDYFYDHNKPRYLSFEIQEIQYSDNFTRAKAVVLCAQRMTIGLTSQVFKVPVPSTWKLENGNWYWWVDPKLRNLTPFGVMKPGPETTAGGGQPAIPGIPTSPDFLFKQIKLDKTTLVLPHLLSGEVAISNTAPGNMKVSVTRMPPGIEAHLSKTDLAANEKATLTVTAGKDAKSGDLLLRVDPTGQILTVAITIK